VLSQNAKDGFNELLAVCLNESLKSPDYPDWTIKEQVHKDIKEKELFMLTISSYNFRMFLILHFSQNYKTSSFIARLLKVESDKLNSKRFYDYLGELGNGFCGIYKRELGKYFPFLGMSTPNLLSSEVINHLSIFDYEYESHCLATINDEIEIYGSVYVSSYDDIDFKYITNSLDEDVKTSELEFF